MALAALAPLLGSLAGGSLAGAGALSGLGLGAGMTSLLGSSIGSGLGTLAATGDIGKGLESGALGFGLGGLMGGFGGVTPSSVAQGINSFTGSSLPVSALTPGAATAADPLGALTGTSGAGLANSMASIAPVDLSNLSAQMATIPGAGATAATSPMAGMLGGIGGMPGLLKAGEVALPGLSMIPAPGSDIATPTYSSPGLTPYKTRSAAAIPAGYNAGTMPEMSYFTPYGGYAAGGRISGPDMSGMGAISPPSPDYAVPPVAGDGTSDSIAATVDGKSPALLSADEHVIDAATVAHLGNGSSAAGHQALKKMVNRVRVAKTGRASMPARINPQAMMPM